MGYRCSLCLNVPVSGGDMNTLKRVQGVAERVYGLKSLFMYWENWGWGVRVIYICSRRDWLMHSTKYT